MPDEDDEATRIKSLDSLHAKIDALMHTGGGKKETREVITPAGDVQSQVEAAVAKASERERARTTRERRDQDLNDRFEKLEKLMERSPVNLRPVTKVFWGEQ